MELPNASEMKKSIAIDKRLYDKIVGKITKNKTGRVTQLCGLHIEYVTHQGIQYALSELISKNYGVTTEYNSFGVPYFVITW